ncbi:hypothetical protein Sjap_004295 [Stephania japonica]|uniref:Uncharacterized protein n=1 Tax=Stephania japonica TaxID=461633 RepID=A0AAP0K459_9MAGN
MIQSSSITLHGIGISHFKIRNWRQWKSPSSLNVYAFPHFHVKHGRTLCSKLTPWQPFPLSHAPNVDGSGNIFESLSREEITESRVSNEEDGMNEEDTSVPSQPLKWPMWVLGPSVLLVTGMVPTLWLPLSSVFIGANIASLLSLVGLDCIFNIGATLFLLMADACARPKNVAIAANISEAPKSYRFWNIVASLIGFAIPLGMLLFSHKGLLQTQLSFISFGVLLGPYLLLLSVQMITEMLTWHWQSPVWLMTPVVYEAYRVLQLMRGLRLSADVGAPMWTVETIRVLVSWWVLILGMQLMRVAWFAGFTARVRRQA